jgi:cytidylate kinase
MTQPSVITIDGPAASGKSTIGHMLANELDYIYLDTGSMYRAVTLAALNAGINVADEDEVTLLSKKIDMDVKPLASEEDGRQYTVLLDGSDVTWELRTPLVDTHVSLVSSYPGVRQEMVRRQRQFGKRGHIVMVGRDIGTVVMPTAPLKLYITASPEERARRRWIDRKEQGHSANYDAILTDVNRRDQFDSSREVSPLKVAEDAIIINNTGRSPEIILAEILDLIKNSTLVGT